MSTSQRQLLAAFALVALAKSGTRGLEMGLNTFHPCDSTALQLKPPESGTVSLFHCSARCNLENCFGFRHIGQVSLYDCLYEVLGACLNPALFQTCELDDRALQVKFL